MSKQQKQRIARAKRLLHEAADAVRALTDYDIPDALESGAMTALLTAIVPSGSQQQYSNLNEFFLAYKNRLSLLAKVRQAIIKYHAYPGITQDGSKSVMSPFHIQWYEDGVLFLQSRDKPFEGLMGLYRKDKSLSYAVAAKTIEAGEECNRDSFAFLGYEEVKERVRRIVPKNLTQLSAFLFKLEQMVKDDTHEEREYQELLRDAPWLLGLEYINIERHSTLDDRNIPDFTGIRAKDDKRDIIEIKKPNLVIFKQDGEYHSEFNQVWNQAERYYNFAIQERDYLSRKNLVFDNPRCIIIAGRRGKHDWMDKLSAKQRLQPYMWFLTYDDLLTYARHTIQFIEQLCPAEWTGGTTDSGKP